MTYEDARHLIREIIDREISNSDIIGSNVMQTRPIYAAVVTDIDLYVRMKGREGVRKQVGYRDDLASLTFSHEGKFRIYRSENPLCLWAFVFP